MRKIVFVIIFSMPVFFSFAQHGKEPIRVTDMLNIKTLSNVSLSKDGSKAAFTVTSIEPETDKKWEYKYVTQIWMTATDARSAPRQLTTKENSTQPQWSPDGKQLAFTRSVDGKPQIFILSLNGGEAIQLTNFKYGASNPKWSPGGTQILFSSTINLKDLLKDSLLNPNKEIPKWPFEKPGFPHNENLRVNNAKPDPDGTIESIRSYLDNNATDKKAKVIDKLNFQDEMDVNAEITFNQFFIIDVATPLQPVLMSRIFYRFKQAVFTPDGKQIVLSASVDSTQHPDRVLENEIFIVNTDGKGFRQLIGGVGKNYDSPSVSPSGKWLAFTYSTTSFVTVPTLAIMPITGSVKDMITIPFDRNKDNLRWSNDEKYIYFSSSSNGGVPVFRADIKTNKVEQLCENNIGVASYDLAGDKLAFVKIEVADPSELYIMDASGKNPLPISNFNTAWIAKKKISFPEKRTFTNNKGETIEYWVMKPINYEPGKKYPLLLEIHGGPSAMWGPGEASMWHEYQFFCSKGYGVVYCNPRGSGGYGLDFLRSNINDWGAGPSGDVLTALDKTVSSESWADTSKLFITGGSYAGYLVAWIIGHDHRFKAACSQRGVYDLSTFFGEGNAWRLVPNYFGGYPWDPATREILQRESPINYVQNITTPYIIFHGDNDRRTGYVESEMLYRSLKVLGRPVEYIRHPNGTHELTRSGNNRQRIDQMLRTYEFFERWIK